MKTEKPFPLNHSQIKELLMHLSITDCRRAVSILRRRIDLYEQERLLQRAKKKGPAFFLDNRLSEYDLPTRLKKQLQENGIITVRDITDIGFDGLLLIRKIGERSVREIKEVVFEGRQ